jgi:hypothetical protein
MLLSLIEAGAQEKCLSATDARIIVASDRRYLGCGLSDSKHIRGFIALQQIFLAFPNVGS